MEINPVGNANGTGEIEILQLKHSAGRCIYYREEICSAPKAKFGVCKTCGRIDPQFALSSLLEKIKQLAVNLFNQEGIKPEQFPPEQ